MSKRYEMIGIKQTIRFEWMQKTTNLLLAGLDEKTIRQELHEFLDDKKGNGTEGKRSKKTRAFVVNNLMKIWVSPDPELTSFRDASLAFLRDFPSMGLAVHWGMISAAYPFWFNVARQTGRLLFLQGRVTQAQIVSRLKEIYGDRQTVSRCAQFVIRSFVVWGTLKDSEVNGCYQQGSLVNILDSNLALLMFESALLASPSNQINLRSLCENPAFFSFKFLVNVNKIIVDYYDYDRVNIYRYGLDELMITVK